jgi:hypothetical protein
MADTLSLQGRYDTYWPFGLRCWWRHVYRSGRAQLRY